MSLGFVGLKSGLMMISLVLSCLLSCALCLDNKHDLTVDRNDVVIEVNETTKIVYQSRVPLTSDIHLYFNHSEYYDIASNVKLEKSTGQGALEITGRRPVSESYIDVVNCTSGDNTSSECSISFNDVFVRVTVIKSHVINFLTTAVGWIYFSAWSLSFYPQIYLNFKRKSVTGLNFDFLLLNIIGFSFYSMYNLFMYCDPYVQAEYQTEHPRSPIPVLMNDVIFALHALTACVVTAAQCFFYERENQTVSKTCIALSSVLILFAACSALASLFKFISVLQLVMCFSYVKMVVTLSKYFPQMFFNFRRKSTVGWSIGNILLDFTGGFMDILQMILQCVNVSNWVAFYGNPVKFGLGLVSICFDIIFIIQHYVLYRGVKVVHAEYGGVQNPQAPQSSSPTHDMSVPSNQPILEDIPI
ncbi:hypothetical protein KIN20_001962 [Parelaphostrongylus tenuis]|uniref:Cystinosin homolog n=1 Tax=Parelaphostrongylus tenuis TaxID=148309 RepID=A0AAD5MMW2_PARTN|nr:hypothetical protein KIN20_001962 [Parelaphostrongylus tenuis]